MIDIEKTLKDFEEKEIRIDILNTIKSGKEASVYRVLWNNEVYALKIYKDNASMSFNRYAQYREGKYIKKPSERKALAKKNRYGRKLMEKARTSLEFKMLAKFYKEGAHIPQVYESVDNAIIMEYLGDGNNPAPRIKDIPYDKETAKVVFEKIIQSMKIFWREGVVHGDLSEFNILWWNNEPYIIDFPQAIDIRTNPNAKTLLERDIKNISNFFGKYFPINQGSLLLRFDTSSK